MPRVFELFGKKIDELSNIDDIKEAKCPFMEKDCDGGGNRYLSQIDLSEHEHLRRIFNKPKVHAGICSIEENGFTWAICPRRLLYLGSGNKPQLNIISQIINLLYGNRYDNIGIWSEIHLEYEDQGKSFNYTFDFILSPFKNQEIVRKPCVVEIMTCSTSGGNKAKGTTIPQAFINAVRAVDNKTKASSINTTPSSIVIASPSINKRQVWARMVSQLIVKSEVAIGWRGKALWVIQDSLAKYIEGTTGLDLSTYRANQIDHVSLLVVNIQNSTSTLYSGKISQKFPQKDRTFQDIIRAPIIPPVNELYEELKKKVPVVFKVP